MSASHDDSSEPAEAHQEGDHDHEPFDGNPTSELAPGEPRTPGWIPLTGLALFLAAGIYFLATMEDESNAEGTGPAASSSAQPAVEAAAPAAPAARPTILPQPRAAGSAPQRVPELSPDQAEQLKRKIEEMRAKREKEQKQ